MITSNPQLLSGYELLNRDKINNSLINLIANSLVEYRQDHITKIGYMSNTQKLLVVGFHDSNKISYISNPSDEFRNLYYIDFNNYSISGITFSDVNILQSQEYIYNSTYDQYYDIYRVVNNKLYFSQPFDDDDTIQSVKNSTFHMLLYYNKNITSKVTITQSKVDANVAFPFPSQLFFGAFDQSKNLKIYKVYIQNFLKSVNPSTINQLDILDIIFNQQQVPSLPDVNNYIRIVHTVAQSSFDATTLNITIPAVDSVNQNLKISFASSSGNISNYIQPYDVFLFGIQTPYSIYFYSDNEFKIHADNSINITIDANSNSSNQTFVVQHDGQHSPDNYSEGVNGQTELFSISESGLQINNIKRNYYKINDGSTLLFEVNNTTNSDRDTVTNNATSGVNTRFTYNGFVLITGHDKTADEIGLEVTYNIKGKKGLFDELSVDTLTITDSVTINGDLTVTGTTTFADQSSANNPNHLVRRDANGNFSAGTITATLSGNQSTATKLKDARTITLSGSVTGSQSFDGSQNITISTTTNHTHPSGDISDQTSDNTPNTVVKRDTNGNFAAGTITATLSGNQSTATKLKDARTITLSGSVTGSQSFDGSQDITISTTTNHTHPSSGISDQTSDNTPNTIVKRDNLGSFSQQNIDVVTLSNSGTNIISNSKVYNAVWNDIQEQFEVNDEYKYNTDLLKSWINQPIIIENGVVSKLPSYDKVDQIIGIATNEYGHVLNQSEDELWKTKIPVSLQGTLTLDISLFAQPPHCYEYVIIDKETLKYKSVNKYEQNWYEILAKVIYVDENIVKILIK